MEADDEEDYSVPNPVEAPLMTEDELRQESYREDGEGASDDPEVEDHPIQLRCVLEISNTGGPFPPPPIAFVWLIEIAPPVAEWKGQ